MPAGNRAVEAGLQRGGDGEIDQHVAMVWIDREAGIFGDRGGDRAAHAAVGGEKGEADRLLVGAHGRLMAQPRCPRNRAPGRASPYRFRSSR